MGIGSRHTAARDEHVSGRLDSNDVSQQAWRIPVSHRLQKIGNSPNLPETAIPVDSFPHRRRRIDEGCQGWKLGTVAGSRHHQDDGPRKKGKTKSAKVAPWRFSFVQKKVAPTGSGKGSAQTVPPPYANAPIGSPSGVVPSSRCQPATMFPRLRAADCRRASAAAQSPGKTPVARRDIPSSTRTALHTATSPEPRRIVPVAARKQAGAAG